MSRSRGRPPETTGTTSRIWGPATRSTSKPAGTVRIGSAIVALPRVLTYVTIARTTAGNDRNNVADLGTGHAIDVEAGRHRENRIRDRRTSPSVDVCHDREDDRRKRQEQRRGP